MTTAPPLPPAASGGAEPGTGDPSPAPPDSSAGRATRGEGSGRRPPAVPGGHRVRYAVVGLVLVGALGFLVAKGLGTALNFYLPANQALAQRATLGSKTFNLEGVVEQGSIHATSVGVDFVVTAGSARVQVLNTGSPPDLFQANIPVIAVGHFAGPSFVSDQILVKHSSTYIAQHPARVTAPNGTKR